MPQNNYYDALLQKKEEQNGSLKGSTTSDVTQEPGVANDPDSSINASLGAKGSAAPKLAKEDAGAETETASAESQAFKYSWDKKAAESAQTKLSSDILTAETESVTNRSGIDQSAREYQTQSDMAPYVNAQNAEKVGWTGGYVLDQKRQTEYMKASIQAQLYGAMELQKYGYDSALAAARLSYDLNMQSYAKEYYESAVQTALSEAQLTGTYVSAEYRDMISQYQTAKGIQGDSSASDDDKKRAANVISSINGWLSANGVTEQAFSAMASVLSETQKTLDQKQLEWKMYQAAIESQESKMEDNPSIRFEFNDDGTVKVDGSTGQAITFDMSTASKDKIAEYVKTQQGEDSYYSYIRDTMVGEIQSGFQAWAKGRGKLTYDSEGNLTGITGDVNQLFNEYLRESEVLNKYSDKLDVAGKDFKESWVFHITLPDNATYDVNYNTLSKFEAKATNTPQTNAVTDPSQPQYVLSKWKTYDWMDDGNPTAKSLDQLRTLKVGRHDGETSEASRWEMSKIVGDEIAKMGDLVSKGTYGSGTLFWLERNGDSHETYLVLYYDGSYYLVSNDDRERKAGLGDEGEGATYARYEEYKGQKVKIRGGNVVG